LNEALARTIGQGVFTMGSYFSINFCFKGINSIKTKSLKTAKTIKTKKPHLRLVLFKDKNYVNFLKSFVYLLGINCILLVFIGRKKEILKE